MSKNRTIAEQIAVEVMFLDLPARIEAVEVILNDNYPEGVSLSEKFVNGTGDPDFDAELIDVEVDYSPLKDDGRHEVPPYHDARFDVEHAMQSVLTNNPPILKIYSYELLNKKLKKGMKLTFSGFSEIADTAEFNIKKIDDDTLILEEEK